MDLGAEESIGYPVNYDRSRKLMTLGFFIICEKRE